MFKITKTSKLVINLNARKVKANLNPKDNNCPIILTLFYDRSGVSEVHDGSISGSGNSQGGSPELLSEQASIVNSNSFMDSQSASGGGQVEDSMSGPITEIGGQHDGSNPFSGDNSLSDLGSEHVEDTDIDSSSYPWSVNQMGQDESSGFDSYPTPWNSSDSRSSIPLKNGAADPQHGMLVILSHS